MTIYTKANQGFSTLLVIAVVAVLAVGGGAIAYYLTDGFGTQKDNDSTTVADDLDQTKQDIDEGQGDSIPAGFPDDMPLYQPSEVISARQSDTTGRYTVGLQAADASEAEVISFYEAELAKAGWTVSENMAMSGMFEVEKDGWTGDVTIHESTTTDIGTTVSIRLSEQ